MRVILAIAIVAAFVLAAWAHNPKTADDGRVPMDPLELTKTVGHLPAHQYDAF